MTVVGFSTGAIALDDFETALRLLSRTSAKAVELSALRASELPALLDALPKIISDLRVRYEYISFHAPTNFDSEEDLIDQLQVISNLNINIIVHPDTIKEVSSWRRLGARLCIENMDSRKAIGRTAEELEFYFENLPDSKLCFDVAHARQVDSSMTEAFHILERFRDRIAQIHISEVNSKGKHFAMSFAAKLAYAPFADVFSSFPVIIEAMVGRERIVDEIEETEKVLRLGRGLHAEVDRLAV